MIDSRSMECLYEHFSAQQLQPLHHREQQRLTTSEDSATLGDKHSKPPKIPEETGRPAAAARSHRSFWHFWRADLSRRSGAGGDESDESIFAIVLLVVGVSLRISGKGN
ncbi:hypothetical protein PG985_012522 [Apiospora marii]|uniref:Uncharacterized protein n=1 Tax=Apiospora marii TaxID=335849 RepID=A0ABR1RD67_9PEZI